MISVKCIVFVFVVFILNKPTTASVIDNTVQNDASARENVDDNYCDRFPGIISVRQREICYSGGERFGRQIAAGGFAAWKKCKQLFGNDSRVCQFETNGMSYGAYWLPEGTREAAFVAALRSAFYVIHVARLCDYDKNLCRCRQFVGRKLREQGTGRYSWIYVNCINSVPYAIRYVKDWTDADNEPTDRILKDLAIFNAERGRELAKKLFFSPSHIECQCDDGGPANSTCCKAYCMKHIPSEQEVGAILYDEYTGVRVIENNNQSPPV